MQRQPSINKQEERFDSILPLYVDCGVGLGCCRHNNIGTKIDTHTAVGTHTSLLKRDFRFKKFVDVVPSGEVEASYDSELRCVDGTTCVARNTPTVSINVNQVSARSTQP